MASPDGPKTVGWSRQTLIDRSLLTIIQNKFIEFFGHFEAKFLAKELDIVIIVPVKGVPGMEFHHPVWRDTFDWMPINRSGSH
jgi:hypothetical protein